MKKIYMRAGISPLDNFSPAHVLIKNSIGNNVGNLIYAYGMFRTLTLKDTTVVPNYYQINPKDADKINEEYDSFVIPLADAFRPDFMPELRKMTSLIQKLKIPCVIAGVGLRAPFEPGADISFPFDKDIKDFMKAVLDKSAIVGVRGEITAAYLSQLGFREGTDHMVIGCPSMYTFGRDLKIRDVKLEPDSLISINSSVLSPNEVLEFLERTMKAVPNHYFLPQRLQELKLLYTGQPYVHNPDCSVYPCNITDAVYEQDRVKYFLRASEWIDFLRQVDLSVGGRLHGNITATIAGAPSILIPHDARMRELTNYHSLTHVWAKDITEKTDIFELAAGLDFQKVAREHGKNFDRFIGFLDKNRLDHIYNIGAGTDEAPLDLLMRQNTHETSVKSIRNCSIEEMAERWQEYYPEAERVTEKIKTENKRLKGKVQKLEKAKLSLQEEKTKLEAEISQVDCKLHAAETIIDRENQDGDMAKKINLFGKKYEIRRVIM